VAAARLAAYNRRDRTATRLHVHAPALVQPPAGVSGPRWSPGYGLAWLAQDPPGGGRTLFFTTLDENGIRAQVPLRRRTRPGRRPAKRPHRAGQRDGRVRQGLLADLERPHIPPDVNRGRRGAAAARPDRAHPPREPGRLRRAQLRAAARNARQRGDQHRQHLAPEHPDTSDHRRQPQPRLRLGPGEPAPVPVPILAGNVPRARRRRRWTGTAGAVPVPPAAEHPAAPGHPRLDGSPPHRRQDSEQPAPQDRPPGRRGGGPGVSRQHLATSAQRPPEPAGPPPRPSSPYTTSSRSSFRTRPAASTRWTSSRTCSPRTASTSFAPNPSPSSSREAGRRCASAAWCPWARSLSTERSMCTRSRDAARGHCQAGGYALKIAA
jgi:hypothetical protein